VPARLIEHASRRKARALSGLGRGAARSARRGWASQPTTQLADELIAYCRQRLAAFKCPRSVDFTEKLPRFDTGKILRRVVREAYWKGREKKI